jgi:fused signal recognition particle receptor
MLKFLRKGHKKNASDHDTPKETSQAVSGIESEQMDADEAGKAVEAKCQPVEAKCQSVEAECQPVDAECQPVESGDAEKGLSSFERAVLSAESLGEHLDERSVAPSLITSASESVKRDDADVPDAPNAPDVPDAPAKGFFGRLKERLRRTRSHLSEGLTALVKGRKRLDDELLEELETRLLMADVGVESTQRVIARLIERLGRSELADTGCVVSTLQEELAAILEPCAIPLRVDQTSQPWVILVVGVNGAGKTTTIGKLARRFKDEGRSVMLAAGDTFRAAAVEQLQVWGERNGIPVVAQQTGSDSASVIFDALQAAKARKIDVLIADTAGRLHTKNNLMEELQKIKRVMGKIDTQAPHEVMLVLDATTGQNGLSQARIFNETMALTGVCLTKLDGTAKGGIIFAIANQLSIPIRFIGVGESIEDLREFDHKEFVSALFDESD